MTRAASPQQAHMARLHAAKVQRATTKPMGNYDHSEHQYGVVYAIHVGPPPSLDLYLDGTQNTNNTAYLTAKVPYLASYAPTVGDTVLVYRGSRNQRSSRIVLGKANGVASPYPLLLGGINSVGQFVQGPNALWGGSGVPAASLGATGDAYWRTDTPSTAGQRLYVKESTGWTATTV